MSSDDLLAFTVTSRGVQHPISLPKTTSITEFQAHLEELTDVPPSFQKLIHKGKNLLASKGDEDGERTLADAGFKKGMKTQLTGSTSRDMTSLQSAEDEQRKRERIMKERALKAPVKVSLLLLSCCQFLNESCPAKVNRFI